MKVTWSWLAIILILSQSITNAGEIRTWTSVAGTTLDAEFVKEERGVIFLKVSDGAIKQIKKSKLVQKDRLEIDRLTDPFAAKKAAKKKAEAEAKKTKASSKIYDMFGNTLRNAQKREISTDTLADKTIGIYFSAHWCPPCRAFTPNLVEFHNEMIDKGYPFEIVFVSWDRDSSAMYNYMKEMDMPWLVLPFGDEYKKQLEEEYQVRNIPTLIIVDSDGDLITKNGRGDVQQSGVKAFRKWK